MGRRAEEGGVRRNEEEDGGAVTYYREAVIHIQVRVWGG